MSKFTPVPAVLLLVLVVLRPHLSGAVYPFTQGLFLIPGLIGLALVLFSPQVDKYLPGGRLRWVLTFPWILCAWSFLSVLWSADQGRGAAVSFTLLLSVTAFTLAFFVTRDRHGEEQSWTLLLTALLVPVLVRALYQHFFGLSRLRELIKGMEAGGQNTAGLMGVISKDRVFAAFLNSNMLAGFLAIFIPLTLDLAITTKEKGRRLLCALLTVGQFGVLILTGSVGGSLAAAAAAGLVFLLRVGIRRRELLWMTVIVITLSAGIILTRGFSWYVGPDNSVVQRIGYMKAGITMAAEKPFAGWGAGSAPGALMGYVPERIRPATDPHNFPIRAWIDWGVPGLALLLFFLALWGSTVLGPVAGTGWRSAPAGYAGLVLGSTAFLLHSLMDMDFIVPETALFGWAVMGASLGAAAVLGREGTAGGSAVGKGVLRFLGGALLVMVLPSIFFMQVEFTGFKASRAQQDGRKNEAADLYREARRLFPFHGRFTLEEGRVRMAIGQRDEAVELFKRAGTLLRYSPYPPWELGRAAQMEGDWDGSIPQLEKALDRYPTSPRIRLDLAQAYFEVGDYRTTIRLLEEVKRYAIFDRDAMGVAVKVLGGPEVSERPVVEEGSSPLRGH